MRNLLKQSSAAIIFCISLDSYRRAVNNDNTTKQSDILIKETAPAGENYQKAQQELVEKENTLSVDNVDTIAKLDRVKELANIANEDMQKLADQAKNQENEELIKNSSEMAKESLSKMMSEINKLAHKFDSSNPNINELLDD
jgi:Skp family chaperone for outer membrane proteins